jgi:hypothetical protein
MERAIFVSDPLDLRHFVEAPFERIYFGTEFCNHLLPTTGQLQRVVEFAAGQNVAVTLVTPPFFDSTFPRLAGLLDLLDAGTEVVFNDWGLFDSIEERSLAPVHGRLLCTSKKDPRIGADAEPYFRQTNLNERLQEHLLSLGIRRVELDNIAQGYDLTLGESLSASLYYPFVQCTQTRKCVRFNLRGQHPKFQIADRCDPVCRGEVTTLRLDDAKVHLMGNAQFYVNDERPSDLADWNVDRTVFMPRFPNHNGFHEGPLAFDGEGR